MNCQTQQSVGLKKNLNEYTYSDIPQLHEEISTLRTVFDLRQQNKNMWKEVTSFPDQDAIHHDIAQAKFRSKLDMTEAYEQMRIRPEDVRKMTFSTIFSTFQS